MLSFASDKIVVCIINFYNPVSSVILQVILILKIISSSKTKNAWRTQHRLLTSPSSGLVRLTFRLLHSLTSNLNLIWSIYNQTLIRCFFSTRATFSTGDQCVEWWRRLNTALAPIGSVQETFAAAYAAWAKEQPPASVHRALMRASHAPHRHWFGPEVRGNRY